MKKVVIALSAVVLACGVSYGQEKTKPNENLKCYRHLIGTWVYEGPLLEDVPGVAKKGDRLVVQQSYKWILDKTTVEMNIYFEFKDEIKISVKGLIGWDAANQQIVGGSMNSRGWIAVDKTTYDQQTKTWTTDLKGVDAEGNPVSWTAVLSLTDENTLTQQGKDRKGGLVQGEEGPKYTYKRVKRAQKAKSDG